ncbi:unnamed protein product [Miscanthus lutarioriparius]|uniref:Uncharacterized protein n=1 Tax=Miscanthus lutarioriparius TaxID=422564 RepID=A0A811RVL0_9POAL|nr:unnamed protein product [Miscanthus lutarioriparius]
MGAAEEAVGAVAEEEAVLGPAQGAAEEAEEVVVVVVVVVGPTQGAAAEEEEAEEVVVVVVGPAQGVAVEEVAVGLAHGAEPEAEGGALEGPEPREEGTHPLVLHTALPVGLEGWAPAAGTTTTTMDMKQEECKGTEMAAMEFGWSQVNSGACIN